MQRSESRSQVMLMCGVSGSGKTFHALRLVSEGYLRLSTDAIIWNRFGKELHRLSPEQKRTAFMEAAAELRMRVEDCLKKNQKIVVDATHCRREVRDNMRNLCQQFGIRPLFVYCDASEDILWERLSVRKGEDSDSLPVTREELSRYTAGFCRPQPDEKDFINAEKL